MKALVSSIEECVNGYRIAQVETDDGIFPVAEPAMFWVTCEDGVVADKYWYDPADQSIKPIPAPTVES